jgi:homoserine dehydrogenase
VLGDLVAVARNRVAGGHGPRESAYAELPVHLMGDTPTSFHLSLEVADRPGVLAQVAIVFAEHEVSISAVRQTVRSPEDGMDGANLVIVTHVAPDAALRATVEKVAGLDAVRAVVSVMRVEGEVT